jgi:hypothetical protein
MTGVAGDFVLSEIDFIIGFDRQHHLHHAASRLLLRFVITFPNPVCESGLWIFPLLDMAEVALHAERRSNKIHDKKELRVRQTLEHLNVRVCSTVFSLCVACRGVNLSGTTFVPRRVRAGSNLLVPKTTLGSSASVAFVTITTTQRNSPTQIKLITFVFVNIIHFPSIGVWCCTIRRWTT